MQQTLHRQPKIMKALSRAITHELKKPGELTDFLTYSAIIAGSREVDREAYLARRATLKAKPKITKRYVT